MSAQPQPGRALLDALVEAALERDQATYADWWGHLKPESFERQAALAAWRRGYAAAWYGGASQRVVPGRKVTP